MKNHDNVFSMIVLGISFGHHDSGACLLKDGNIVAAVAEERLSRVKKDSHFPIAAIREVLKIAKLKPEEIQHVAIASTQCVLDPNFDSLFSKREESEKGNDNRHSFLRNSTYFQRARRLAVPSWYLKRKNGTRLIRELHELGLNADIEYFDHHLSHAASVYFTADFENPTIITIDGVGDNLSATVSIFEDGMLKVVHKTPWWSSPGLFYTFITGYLGFKRKHHEGKITGLAAYGDSSLVYKSMKEYLAYDREKEDFSWPILREHPLKSLLLKWRVRWWEGVFRETWIIPKSVEPKDIAAAAQRVLEESVCEFIRHFIRKTGKAELALAGGIFANVKLNQRIAELSEIKQIFIYPAMGDDGIAAGAAYLFAFKSGEVKPKALNSVYLGPSFSDDEIKSAIERHGIAYSLPDNVETTAAEALARGAPVILYQGRMEYGPRALGNRSVLCSPKDKGANDWLNKRFNRTEFMPFAPVTLENHASKCYVDYEKSSRAMHFMTICVGVTSYMEETQPAVVHVDATARPQLITREENSRYYGILEKFEALTGLPSLINTSFNMHEEPIVCTPEDALRAFIASKLPYMVMENFFLTNQESQWSTHGN